MVTFCQNKAMCVKQPYILTILTNSKRFKMFNYIFFQQFNYICFIITYMKVHVIIYIYKSVSSKARNFSMNWGGGLMEGGLIERGLSGPSRGCGMTPLRKTSCRQNYDAVWKF